MKKQIAITLFGAAGMRTLEITPRDGFPTRHIKVPHETAPSLSVPVNPKPVDPKSDAFPESPTLLEVLKWMEASENHHDWLIIDEILFVATAHYKMKFNHRSLLDALRGLYEQGLLSYRRNKLDQHTFRLIENQETNLKVLLVEVDALLGEGRCA